MFDLDEDPAHGCRAIAHFMRQAALKNDEEKRRVALRDLCWRIVEVEPAERMGVLGEAFSALIPPDLRKEFRSELEAIAKSPKPKSRREKRHAAVITILGTELKAVLIALGRDPESPPSVQTDDFHAWDCSLLVANGDTISLVVILVGRSRNTRCAMAVSALGNRYQIDAALIVGIAAGVRGKVNLGDVIIPDQVLDYEEQRLEKRKILFGLLLVGHVGFRPDIRPIHRKMLVPVERFSVERFQSAFSESRSKLRPQVFPSSYDLSRLPSIHDGTIVAGDKLIADGSLVAMRKKYDQRIVGGDMEDSGFAYAADSMNVPWCVFRGVSDFGDPQKENGWQFIAAFAAATAAVQFLVHSWGPSQREVRRGIGGPR